MVALGFEEEREQESEEKPVRVFLVLNRCVLVFTYVRHDMFMCSVQFNSHLFSSPIGARTVKCVT